MNKRNIKSTESEIKRSLREYSGAAENSADDDRVNQQLIRERTATINNNPRNNEKQRP